MDGKRNNEEAFWLDENHAEPEPALIYEYQTLLRKMKELYAEIKEGDASKQKEWVESVKKRESLEEAIRASGGDPKEYQITIH